LTSSRNEGFGSAHALAPEPVIEMTSAQRPEKKAKGFQDISHYFLSAAEADVSTHAMGTAGHLEDQTAQTISTEKPESPKRKSKPARRKDNCAACAHLIARAGRPFQCRIYSVEYEKHGVEQRENIHINEGHTCPYFMRVTSKQIEDILRNHDSALRPDQLREYAQKVDEQVVHTKTVTIGARLGAAAEEVLREHLLNYLIEGYSIAEATLIKQEEDSESEHPKTTTHKINLRIEKKD
jgi:hypothetical protein